MDKNASPEGIVAARLFALRTARKWTRRDLATACVAAGAPHLTGHLLYKIEGGRRRVVVDEVFALACALGVSPLALMLPTTADAPVALTGSLTVPAVAAYEWMVGDRPTPEGGLRVGDEARFAALTNLHEHVPYAAAHARRTVRVKVDPPDARKMAGLYNMLINPEGDKS